MSDPSTSVIGLFIATDQRDWEKVEQLFSDEVLLDYSSMTGNEATTLKPTDITTAWKGILPGFQHTHHQIGNITTQVTGDRAAVFCYGTATHYLADESGNLWTVVGSYDFELASNDGLWTIDAMKFNFKYQDGNTSLPEKAMNSLK